MCCSFERQIKWKQFRLGKYLKKKAKKKKIIQKLFIENKWPKFGLKLNINKTEILIDI